MSTPDERDHDPWRERLTPEEYEVLREGGTERPYTGEYWDTKDVGVYSCRACGAELFRSQEKFDSHCGWPSFFAPLAEDRVDYREDTRFGMIRTEARCASCGSHLGHVFEGEGYDTPTDRRYCINSISLRWEPAPEQEVDPRDVDGEAPGGTTVPPIDDPAQPLRRGGAEA